MTEISQCLWATNKTPINSAALIREKSHDKPKWKAARVTFESVFAVLTDVGLSAAFVRGSHWSQQYELQVCRGAGAEHVVRLPLACGTVVSFLWFQFFLSDLRVRAVWAKGPPAATSFFIQRKALKAPLNRSRFSSRLWYFNSFVRRVCMRQKKSLDLCATAVTALHVSRLFDWFNTQITISHLGWDLTFGFYSFRHQCRRHCPQDTYEDWGRGVCMPCPLPCTDCRSSAHCLACQPGYFLNGTRNIFSLFCVQKKVSCDLFVL